VASRQGTRITLMLLAMLFAVVGLIVLFFAVDSADGVFGNSGGEDDNYVEPEPWEQSPEVKALTDPLLVAGFILFCVAGIFVAAASLVKKMEVREDMRRPKPGEPALFPPRPGESERRLCKWCGELAKPEHKHCGKCGKRL